MNDTTIETLKQATFYIEVMDERLDNIKSAMDSLIDVIAERLADKMSSTARGVTPGDSELTHQATREGVPDLPVNLGDGSTIDRGGDSLDRDPQTTEVGIDLRPHGHIALKIAIDDVLNRIDHLEQAVFSHDFPLPSGPGLEPQTAGQSVVEETADNPGRSASSRTAGLSAPTVPASPDMADGIVEIPLAPFTHLCAAKGFHWLTVDLRGDLPVICDEPLRDALIAQYGHNNNGADEGVAS